MSASLAPSPHAVAHARVSFAHQAVAAVSKLMAIMRNRREFRRLGEMSDIELADIGLTRADLQLVSELPLTDDPTARLGTLIRRRAA